jgi:glycerophosphoryl diester phosphodiesterase
MASPTVIAHRGASAAHPPGNTIDAFRAAGPLGATWVELDVRRCADGSLAVHHDPELPDGRALVELTREAWPDWVPSLSDALDACEGLGVNVEIKNNPGDLDFDETESLAAAVVDLLHERGGRDEVLVSSFHLRTIDRVRSLDPAVPTAFLVVAWAAPAPTTLELCAARGHAAVHPWHGLVTDEVVQVAQGLDMAVNVWTVDDPDEIAALAALGVDGIVTNVPDVAVAALSG